MGLSKHDKIAKNLAREYMTEYNKGRGPDIKARNRIIEVATHKSNLHSSLKQLSHYQKPKYIATTPDLVKKVKEVKEVKEGTGIDVMGPTGTIRKKAGGK